MKPHKTNPISRKIDVDISSILLGPGNIRTTELSDNPVSTSPKPAVSFVGPAKSGIGPFGWININFVAVSGLIALFCAILIQDNFEYSRRSAHLPPDASDLKPEFNPASSQRFTLEPSRVVSAVQLDLARQNAEESVTYSNQAPFLSSPSQFRADQALGSFANNSGLADRALTSSSSAVSSESSGPARLSRTTSSSAENAGGAEQTSSSHSSMRKATRLPRRSMSSSRASTPSNQRTIRHSLANGLRGSAAAKSGLRATRENLTSMTIGNRHGRSITAKTQITTTGSLMSMHSLGAGVGIKQSHGAMNPMRMESGMLAQPGIGAGLGGVSGNGLGGGGGSQAGNRIAK